MFVRDYMNLICFTANGNRDQTFKWKMDKENLCRRQGSGTGSGATDDWLMLDAYLYSGE